MNYSDLIRFGVLMDPPGLASALSPARATPLGYDVFSGSGTLSGTAPLIGPNNWATSGTITEASGRISAASNAYAYLDVDAVPVEIGGVFRNVGAAAATTMAFLLNPADLADMVHINFGPTNVNAKYWKTAVGTDQAFTWQNNPAFTSLAADTDYVARAIIKGNFITAWVEDTSGNVLGRSTAYDTVIPSIVGQGVMWQLAATTSRWSEVWVRSATVRNTSNEAKFNTGVTGPVGMNSPVPGFFTNVHIGTGSPLGLFSMRMVSAGEIPTIIGSGISGSMLVKSETNGFSAFYNLSNGAGGTAAMNYDGSFVHNLTSGGNAWLSKPNSGAPYFAAGLKVNGSSGVTQTDATAKPTTGSYTIGDFVWNKSPAIAGGKVLIGWSRLTTGSGHVADTDWAACYCTNS